MSDVVQPPPGPSGQMAIDVENLPTDLMRGSMPADPAENEKAREAFYLSFLATTERAKGTA